MKKMILALLMLTVTSVFAADIELWKKSTLNDVLERGELRVGLEPGYMPFEMKDKKGRLMGYDIDLAKNMAKAMGVKVKFVPTAWDGIIAGLVTNKYDIIISGMTVSQKRNLKVNFADPYVVVGQTILLRKGLEGKVKSAKDLDDPKYTVVTKLATSADMAMQKFFKKAKTLTFDTESDAISEVLTGKADAMIYDQPYNIIFMAEKGKDKLVHLDAPLTYEPLAWAVRKGDPDFLNWLNNYLRQIKGDKVVDFYEKNNEKWLRDSSWLKRLQ